MKITCVVDNTASFSSKFCAEHGLSILIENDNYKILFDTGRSPEIFRKNMELLNGFEGLKYVILSHGHDDHTGGLSYVLNNSSAKIFIHEKAFLPKYILRNGKMQYIGSEYEPEKSLDFESDKYLHDSNIDLVSKTIEIEPDIYIFKDVLLKNDFEGISSSFFVEKNGEFVNDSFEDELVLVIRTHKGLVVLSGCAHRGIVNTLSSVFDYFKEDIYAVVGGTHLATADETRITKTIEEVKKYNPKYLILGHCNGFNALCRFKEEFENFKILASGNEILEF